MKLLTQEIKKKLPKLYETEKTDLDDKVVICKFFSITSSWTWYVVEGQEEGGDFRFFGLVDGHVKEWAYFMLSELEGITKMGGRLKVIERDLHWRPRKVSEI